MELEGMNNSKGDDGSINFKVIRKMEFNSDRKRMSVLLWDPTDGKNKLFVKGADSIIMERIDQKSLDDKQRKKTDDFLDTASK
jgi:magnesium-transporting ATPase (P-type)